MQMSESSEAMNNQSSDYSSKITDKELATWVRRAASGNREYQKQIYELLADRTYRVVRRIVGESHAEDVMQDFTIHMFAKLGQFRFESSLQTWAHRMAVNQSLQYLRKVNREEQRRQDAVLSSKLFSDSNPHHQTDDADMLAHAMKRISGEQRAILHMKEIEGLGYTAIASILGIPEGTVGSRLTKARNELRNSLIEMGWEA